MVELPAWSGRSKVSDHPLRRWCAWAVPFGPSYHGCTYGCTFWVSAPASKGQPAGTVCVAYHCK